MGGLPSTANSNSGPRTVSSTIEYPLQNTFEPTSLSTDNLGGGRWTKSATHTHAWTHSHSHIHTFTYTSGHTHTHTYTQTLRHTQTHRHTRTRADFVRRRPRFTVFSGTDPATSARTRGRVATSPQIHRQTCPKGPNGTTGSSIKGATSGQVGGGSRECAPPRWTGSTYTEHVCEKLLRQHYQYRFERNVTD